jgi:hypothetical protein
MRLFEYIFYRIAKHYYKRDGSTAFGAVAVLSLIQLMLITDFLLLIRVLFLHQSDVQDYVKYGRTIGGTLAVIMMVVNYFYYKNKYWRLSDRWRQRETEDPTLRKTRGWLVILAIILPFALYLLPFIMHW